MRSSSPGFWWIPQSLFPAMKHEGTSIVRPENVCSSAVFLPLVVHRYHCNPPWKPVRPNSALYTFNSSSGSQRQAAIAAAEGISGATVSAMPFASDIT